MKTSLGIFIALLLTTACATGDRMGEIRAGMSKDQVIGVLGPPDGYTSAGTTEALTYSNRMMSGWSLDGADYHVMLTGGRLRVTGRERFDKTPPLGT